MFYQVGNDLEKSFFIMNNNKQTFQDGLQLINESREIFFA
ncbi:hypothetical protein B4064_2059 [Caldibacillus thermoamylovorans]|uniref:Uncharacterized protein n=1 Tax=Caldibacillus thermoamylovorans TaxID=35841 RepID=A0A0D0FMQ8_9BACI|nr:hypothetical protein B4065_2477 [Caldibacillus thermoamylovorans]KIO66738.1 hypothetical protein B4064_2059 [Caldibacillus thermoamylovorans]KIO68473.1 hypothetical protein B4166_2142 [Caldibacillus thermoamylovorans]KIO73419.1 hypothetical protein B4167_2142 [Caldibacillus thermoamylovorans]